MRERPAIFSVNPWMPSNSLRMMPESWKLRVWSKSEARRNLLVILYFVSMNSATDPNDEVRSASGAGKGESADLY
jgi:hypothetical protein